MKRKTIAVIGMLLTVALLLPMVGCSNKADETPPVPVPVVSPTLFFNLLPYPDGPVLSALPLDLGYAEKLEKKHEENADSAAWIAMDGTTLDDVVMFAPEESDRFFYLRRGFDKEELFEGTYFIDSMSNFSGTRNKMSKNIVVYGHSMDDNPDGEQFSQFKKLHDPNWAKENPYIFFSTKEEDIAWEIFAAFDSHISFIYNIPDPDDKTYQGILDGARKRSIYNYDVDVTTDDKIITMSTCIYDYNGTPLSYPNDYRFVIMARQVPFGEKLKEDASFEINKNIYIDS